MLMAVVAADGRPVVFADTNIYYWMGEMQFRPVRYALSPMIGGPRSAATDPDAADEAPAEMQLRRTEMAARSPWFGMMLYAIARQANLWWLTLLQSVAMSFAVHSAWRALLPQARARTWYGLMAGLAGLTTLPFFAGFAMPDVWAGGGVIAALLLVFLRDRLRIWEKAGLWLLALAAMAFHQSNAMVIVPVTFAFAATGVGLNLNTWRKLTAGLFAVAAAVTVPLILNAAYSGAVRHATGEILRSPPFLAARVLADGPGRIYLRKSCAEGQHWALCRFRNLPLNDSQDILWSGDPGKGVFGRANAAERIQIDQEQTRFAIAAVMADPAGAIKAGLGNFGKALSNLQLEDPLRDPHFYLTDPDWRDTYIADMVHAMGPCGSDERACKPRFSEAQSRLWHGGAFLVSLTFVLWVMCRSAWRARLSSHEPIALALTMATAFILTILISNAAVTGVLSGPFPRYQARLTWLLPLIAGLLAIEQLEHRKAFGGDGRRD